MLVMLGNMMIEDEGYMKLPLMMESKKELGDKIQFSYQNTTHNKALKI